MPPFCSEHEEGRVASLLLEAAPAVPRGEKDPPQGGVCIEPLKAAVPIPPGASMALSLCSFTMPLDWR
jgi:hypothetical protein